jgi:hypothetical protein
MQITANQAQAFQTSIVAVWDKPARAVAVDAISNGLDQNKVKQAVRASGLDEATWRECLKRVKAQLFEKATAIM